MKKPTLICLLVLFSFNISFAQRKLELKEKTEDLSVFTDKDPEIANAGGKQAGVTISCSGALQLNFSSNVDTSVDVYKTEERGGSRFYYLRFVLGKYKGASYDNRILEVLAQGFVPLKFKLDLVSGESKWYEIFDPNATVGVGCFYQYYNEGVDLFKKALYQEAQEKYKLSMECSDIPPDLNVKERIANIDSILSLRKAGDYFYDMLHFKEALDCYRKIISYNSDDLYAAIRSREANLRWGDNCNNYFTNAEDYFINGKYDEAKKLYEFILQQSCPKSMEANSRLTEIGRYMKDRRQRAQVILYQYGQDVPIGISVGKYREKKVAGYFSIAMNSMLFEAIRQNDEKSAKPELDLSFGWTINVYSPVWIFFGPGYTGVGEWDYDHTSGDSKTSGEEQKPKFLVHSAVSPEIGILGKIGPVALRYTFQYRFALEKDYQDYIGSTKHFLGIGFCF